MGIAKVTALWLYTALFDNKPLHAVYNTDGSSQDGKVYKFTAGRSCSPACYCEENVT